MAFGSTASRSGIVGILAALLLTACGSGSSAPADPGAEPAGPSLELLSFEQEGIWEVRRDEPLVLVFSAALDPRSIRPGTIRLVRRSGLTEIPVGIEVDGSRVRLTPPEPFGFEPETRYELTVRGFPSFQAPLSLDGTPLRTGYRGTFSTNRHYQPDLVPPTLASVELDEEPGDHWSVRLVFSEPVDPQTVGPDTVTVEDDADGRLFGGRYIHDRSAVTFHFLPDAAHRPTALRVTLTRGVQDLAGNSLSSDEPVERVLVLPPVPLSSRMGELVEDFTTDEMVVAGLTTALWNHPSAPGALLGRPATTVKWISGGDLAPAEPVALGPGPVRIRMVLTPEELGPARELTGLAWEPAGGWVAAARYEYAFVRITPTERRSPEEPGRDLGPSVVVVDQKPYDVKGGASSLVTMPFAESYPWDGASCLLLEITIGPGDRTNFLEVATDRSGASRVLAGSESPGLRPSIALRGFTMEPSALSRFYDSGSDSPEYFDPVISPSDQPRGVTMEVEFQGRHSLEDDLARDSSDWTDDVVLLRGYRYIRFRVRFRGISLTGEEPLLDDLRIPFRR